MKQEIENFIDELFILKLDIDNILDKLNSIPHDGEYNSERENLRLRLSFEYFNKLEKVYRVMEKYNDIF